LKQTNHQIVDVANLIDGIYIVKVTTKSNTLVKTLIVKK